MQGRKPKVYALYKGEDCLAIGTKREISEQLDIKMETLDFYTTKAYKERMKQHNHTCKEGFRELIVIEDDEGVEDESTL